jgi:hypothetical protein
MAAPQCPRSLASTLACGDVQPSKKQHGGLNRARQANAE